MANSYFTNPIVLDTFTSAIDLRASSNYPAGQSFKVRSIQWQQPGDVGDGAKITDKVNGTPIFEETCSVAFQSIPKYFPGDTWVDNIYIAASGVESGKIVIYLG